MFEGLVRQLLLGYLGRYIKDIQKEQLKITLWNEEVLLENVELILEAFDYLQLPFALKEGRVGRLSIKIPWKKLGWDPIIIIIEDVFVCACQRDDQEWSMDAVERREFAGKKAKLAAAELAKLSRRVCGNQAGQSFVSYISTKILDGIQVSIRNVHILYRSVVPHSAQTVFGVKFSSLTIMRQNSLGGKVRGGQVNKTVEIQGFQIYCYTCPGNLDLAIVALAGDPKLWGRSGSIGKHDVCVLAPVDVSMSLEVSRSANENGVPQYSVNAETTTLAMSLDEVQLQQILALCDYLSICELREKYGRYRPWNNPLSRKRKGWQIVWWHYAQQSVLSDIRKRLKKNSWKYLGERLTYRRKYVNLYKTKLKCLREEQFIDDHILGGLEQMERQCDVEDILNYRSIAESELQDFLQNSSSSLAASGGLALEKAQNDDYSSNKSRGWLNWLSLGMLGAGGTDDSSQFSGVVSDEVIKDIYEATKFQPTLSLNGDSAVGDHNFFSEIKFYIHQVSATLWNTNLDRAVAEILFTGMSTECKIWEESAVVITSVNSGRMINTCNKQDILLASRASIESNVLEAQDPSLSVQIDLSSVNQELKLLVKVKLQPVEVVYDPEFFLNVSQFYSVLDSAKSQHERVMLSLNGIDNARARVTEKAKYVLSKRAMVILDVNVMDIKLGVPLGNAYPESSKMVLEMGSVKCVSKYESDCSAMDFEEKVLLPKNYSSSDSTRFLDDQLQDFYHHFEIEVNGCEVTIINPCHPRAVSILEKFDASVSLASCVIPNEPVFEQFQVYIVMPSLDVHFSPSIYGAVLAMIANFDASNGKPDSLTSTKVDSLNIASSELRNVGASYFSVNVSLTSIHFHIDLENDKENGCTLMLHVHELSIRYNLVELQKLWISVKALKVISQSSQVDMDDHLLCSFGHPSLFANPQDIADKKPCQNGTFRHTSSDRCFLLHYEEQRNREIVLHKYTIYIGDVDCHCYPDIIRLLIEFADKITQYTVSYNVENASHADTNGDMPTQMSYFGVEKFGFSNFYEAGSFYGTCISSDCFPFVTIYNSGYLGNLEDILVHSTIDWRKYFEVGNREIRSPKSNMNKSELSQDIDSAIIIVDIDLTRMRTHFHDSSSTIAAIFLPTTKLSLSFHGDSFDILCSNKGLVLSSSWWTQNIQDYLWGPSSSDLSPIMNVRVRKQKDEFLGSKLEMSFSIQHVACVLPPEFLSVIIGYFSLPDWCNKDNEVTPSSEGMDSGGNCVIIYKFEVLDSTLFVPVESKEHRFLKLDIPQLYSSYIPDSCSELLIHGIPPECLVPATKISERSHCLNVFGLDLSLSLLLLSGDDLYSSLANQYSGSEGIISFITSFSANVWVRIPQDIDSSIGSLASICMMARVDCGELIFKDIYTFAGLESLEDIVEKLSTVDRESKTFTAGIHQFLQSKKTEKGIGTTQPVPSTVAYTEIKCHVKSLSVSLEHLGSNSVSFEQLARTDMQFICSASLENEIARFLEVKFDSLTLFSQLHSVTLAEFTSSCGNSTVLDIHLSVSDQGECEVNVLLPSLDIWLHVFDWIEIIHLLESYQKPQISTMIPDASRNSMLGVVNQVENLSVNDGENSPGTLDASSSTPSGYMEKKDIVLVLKSENIGIKVHIPLQVSREAFLICGEPQSGEGRHQAGSSKLDEGDQYIFAAVALQSRCSELVFGGGTAMIKSNVEKVNGSVRVSEEKCSPSWPLFQVSLVNIDAKISKDELDLVNLSLKIQCDSLDMWLSFHILVFWNCMRFIFPESGPAQSIFGTSELEIEVKKVSLLLTDGRGSSKGPLLELLMRNLLLHAKMSDKKLEASVAGDVLVNYNNMHKVLWEPFVEPWKCQMNVYRIQENSVLLNTVITTDILVTSTAQLNLNVTESLFEVLFRANDVVKDAEGVMGLKFLSESHKLLNSQSSGTMRTGSYAPYMLQNLTSLPLSFYVCKGPVCTGDMNISVLEDGKFMHPDTSIPIHINETSEEQLVDKQLNASAHHYIILQFEGTSLPSVPISMDLVGLSYFEVDFSKSPSKISVGNNGDIKRRSKQDEVGPKYPKRGYVIPVICDVSVQRYCKLIRLYSTVILVNATSLPFEVRFDIPFSVVPKVLDPVYPGQEFPLPLHLAETGRVRWRPFGQGYVWSEIHNISDILSHESRIGSMRSFVCSPSRPSNDPFRCCLSVQHLCFPSIDRPDKSSVLHIDTSGKQTVELCDQNSHNLDRSKKPSIYQVVLCTPLVVRNYLPKAISLSIEGGGISRSVLLSEEETSFFHIDSSHDLEVTFHFNGYKPSILKFQRMETFIGVAKLSGTKYSLSETVVFQPDSCDVSGPLNVSAEKTMDALSGAREICFFVPFLLYNCTGFPLIISDSISETNGHGCIIPSCYDLGDQSLYLGRKDGLGLLCSSQGLPVAASPNDTSQPSLSKNRIVSTRKSNDTDLRELSKKAIVPTSSKYNDLDPLKAAVHSRTNGRVSSIYSGDNSPNMEEMGSRKVEAFMYSPDPNLSVTEIMIRVSKYLPEFPCENMPKDSWSSPFPLVQPTGTTNVLIPHLSSSSAHIVSVSSSAVAGPFSGRMRMITFQPRYVISNACSRNVCYKQKGPDSIFDLGTGQHSHLQWTDTARELLVSIRFKEPGWQWSGCFLPDHLGDTLVKMRNYVTGAVNMIRVEVQNADVSIQEEKIIGNLGGKSGTSLILLSDDDTGFMPYRIDNFSTERLRVYQQRCETFETIVQPYTSCPYAWDEPCYPHRLTVEVVGERILGSFTLDDVSVHIPVYLSKTSEKSERTLLVSVHAEGAVKVLCVVDSSYHVLSGPGDSRVPQLKVQEKHDEERETFVNFKEKIFVDIPFIGISLLSSDPQELLFACAKNTRIELHQSLDQQKFSFQISSFQIDNQLPNAPYPVILSFDREHSSKPVGQTRNKDDYTKIRNGSPTQIASDSISEPVICLAAAKWRNRDIALVSFEYVSLRIGDFHLELEQDVILGLFDFFRTVTSRLEAGGLSLMDSVGPHYTSLGFRKNTHSRAEVRKSVQPSNVRFSPAYESEKLENRKTGMSPLVVPIGAPWQSIHILARKQKKIYVEKFELAPIKLTLSFSSSPWLLRNGVLLSADYLIQRGLMALADVEGAQIRFKELVITHHMASQESIQEIIVRHYTRQLLHEMYKVFGSAGVIGNPMGFARSMGVGIKDFLSVPARSAIQSPAGLVAGMAQGTTSLLSNTVYAISDAATQFSRAAHKGIVAFTFDDQAAARMEKQQKGLSSHSKGVINEILEGLTGLLQSPIRGAEKHGLPGVVSGVALGITGLIARPAASILEVTAKTAQSIRNRSQLHHMGSRRFRMRLPRPLRRDHPLRPYSWEEAVGASVLAEADNGLKLKDELLVACKMLTQGGKFVVLTEKLVLIVFCSCLVDLGKPEFRGVPSELEWVVEAQIRLDTIIHADTSQGVVNIVGSTSNPVLSRERRGGTTRAKHWNNPLTQLPICQTSLELTCQEEAEELLQILLSTIEKGKGGGWGRVNLLHQSNVK